MRGLPPGMGSVILRPKGAMAALILLLLSLGTSFFKSKIRLKQRMPRWGDN
jgi:hypothetical protein